MKPAEERLVEVALDPAAADLDRTLHYALPEAMEVAPGQRVLVPLGSRRVEGLVVGRGDPSQVPLGVTVKKVLSVLDPEPVLGPGLLELAAWIAERFVATTAEAAWVMLPPGLRRNVGPKLKQAWELAVTREEAMAALEGLGRRAPKQASALKRLLDADHPLGTDDPALDGGPLRALADKGLVRRLDVETWRDPAPAGRYQPSTPQTPTPDQARALQEIGRRLHLPQPGSLLLHGVTGSGKTEIYLQAIAQVLAAGRQAIVLVPEIALTPQMIERFKSRFGERVAVLHSRLSDGERYDQWRAIRSGRVSIAVGARSAIFAPFNRVGLIVVDEEHETSYKQQDSPRYHARTVAAQRARRAGALLLLGSATPSLETYWAATRQQIGLVTLGQRIDDRPLPPVELVDLREELAAGNRSIFSRSLQNALSEVLGRGEQAILFLNRRGFSTFVLCRSCGHTMKCPDCDVSLTYHIGATSLTCHYCGHQEVPPRKCPACGSEKIRFFGAGTEKVQAELESLFPGVRALRLDVDTTRGKGAHERILGAFAAGKAQVLVGTQMVAKGLDFPGVTLVGVVAADTALNFPDFRAAERTFQLLTQVAGRSGRGEARGRVVVQTYNPDHYAVMAAAEHDYLRFYEQEMVIRREVGYPPLARLVNLLVTGPDEAAVEALARQTGLALAQVFPFESIWGPNPAPLSKLKGNYRWQVAVRAEDAQELRQGVRRALQLLPKRSTDQARLAVDADPVSML